MTKGRPLRKACVTLDEKGNIQWRYLGCGSPERRKAHKRAMILFASCVPSVRPPDTTGGNHYLKFGKDGFPWEPGEWLRDTGIRLPRDLQEVAEACERAGYCPAGEISEAGFTADAARMVLRNFLIHKREAEVRATTGAHNPASQTPAAAAQKHEGAARSRLWEETKAKLAAAGEAIRELASATNAMPDASLLDPKREEKRATSGISPAKKRPRHRPRVYSPDKDTKIVAAWQAARSTPGKPTIAEFEQFKKLKSGDLTKILDRHRKRQMRDARQSPD